MKVELRMRVSRRLIAGVLSSLLFYSGESTSFERAVPSHLVAQHCDGSAVLINDANGGWRDSFGVPGIYITQARIKVVQNRYRSAARDLQKGARILTQRAGSVYGMDKIRLMEDAATLRLMAKNIEAGAVTTVAQFNSVLDDIHAHVRKNTANTENRGRRHCNSRRIYAHSEDASSRDWQVAANLKAAASAG
jgi:hypothetical protein